MESGPDIQFVNDIFQYRAIIATIFMPVPLSGIGIWRYLLGSYHQKALIKFFFIHLYFNLRKLCLS